jgi:hypothetical protein
MKMFMLVLLLLSRNSFADYKSIAAQIGPVVDNFHHQNELLKVRAKSNDDAVDSCDSEHELFSEGVALYTEEMMKPTPVMIDSIAELFGVTAKENALYPVSLATHPFCIVDRSALSKTMKKVPDADTIEKLNEFATKMNELRENDQEEFTKQYTKLFSCLAYTESLGDADTNTSKKVANKYSPENYRRPAGVLFYEDSYQPKVSRLNIGAFQFTPNGAGNINPCVKAWNKKHVTCKIKENSSQSELIKILGSSFQSFNLFCGVHKLIETYSIQVNTSKASATFPGNLNRPAMDRCVTPHFQAGLAYNHFGPLQNSTGENLKSLMKCVNDD